MDITPWVRDPNGRAIEFPEEIHHRFARLVRARTVSYQEAVEVLQELFIHMEPRDKDRLMMELHRNIEHYYINRIDREPTEYDMARGAMPDMPIYKSRMQDGKIVDYELEMELIKMKHMEIMLKDQTSKELD